MRLPCPNVLRASAPITSASVVLALAVFFGLSQPAFAQAVTARIDANQSVYRAGDTLRVAVDVTTTGAPVSVDIFVFARLPGSQRVVPIVRGVPVFGRRHSPGALWPAARGVRLTKTSPIHLAPYFQYVWKGTEPEGSYKITVLVVRTGPLFGGSIGKRELLAKASDTFDLKRPVVEQVEPAARSESLVAPEGGQVSTVNGQGTIYTLTVPQGALADATSIAITPVTSIGNLPLSGGLAAAVRLEPSGLQFSEPLTLTIDVPGGIATQGLLGFLYNGTGENFEVLPVTLSGNTASVQVSHFSTAGLASGTPADFIAEVGPIVAALPPTLPATQVEELMSLLGTWVDRFGLQLCDGSIPAARTVCQNVYQKGLDALALHVNASCTLAAASLTANEPFAAFNALRDVTAVVVDMARLNDAGEVLGLTAIQPDMPELACIPAALSGIITSAEAEAPSRLMVVIPSGDPTAPFITMMDSTFNLLQDVAANAALINDLDIETAAHAAIGRLLTTLLSQAQSQCATDPLVADALLFRPLQLFGESFLNSLGSPLGQSFFLAAAGCRVTVTPPGATLAPGQQMQFAATLADPDGIPAIFEWQLEPNCGGTLSLAGLYTAPASEGTCEVTAVVPSGGPIAGRRPFFKTVTVTTANNVIVTSRSVMASKSLQAGTATAGFVAGPFAIVQPQIEAFVSSQTINERASDPDPGQARVSESRVQLTVNPTLLNRVISGSGSLGASTSGDAQASVILTSALTAELQGTFDCQLQMTTSAGGTSVLFVRLMHGGGAVFTMSTSSSQTAVCGPGIYTIDVHANVLLGSGPANGNRTFSYTLTLTPRPGT